MRIVWTKEETVDTSASVDMQVFPVLRMAFSAPDEGVDSTAVRLRKTKGISTR